MRNLLCMFMAVALCVMSGCIVLDDNTLPSAKETGETMHQEIEFQGPHYAKPSSIGCVDYADMEIAKLGDFETIDHLIRKKRCFVIPAGKDVFIKERVKDDIVSAKLRDSTELFYTLKSNLVAE